MDDRDLVQWITSLIQHHNIKAFYNSGYWQEARADAIKRDNNECQKCKARGKYGPAECVHHIKHLRKFPQLALTLSNLITLCNSCHDEEHPEKLRHKPKQQLNIERW